MSQNFRVREPHYRGFSASSSINQSIEQSMPPLSNPLDQTAGTVTQKINGRSSSQDYSQDHSNSKSQDGWQPLRIGPFVFGGSAKPNLQIQPNGAPTSGNVIGDTMENATEIGDLTGNSDFVWRGAIGNGNSKDMFKLTLTRSSRMKVSLTGLTDDADVWLLRSDGRQAGRSIREGIRSENFSKTLRSGTYYIQVAPGGNTLSTNYTLSVRGRGSARDAGNSENNAMNSGIISGLKKSYTGKLSRRDPADYYRVEVGSNGTLNAALRGLEGDADLHLLDSQGQEVASSTNNGEANESIAKQVNAGVYYVRVSPYNTSKEVKYTLDLSGSYGGSMGASVIDTLPPGASPSPTPSVGGGNPGSSIGAAENQSSATFSRSQKLAGKNNSHFYRFTTNQSGNFTANLSGLSGDADVRLIRDANNNGSIDQGEVLAWQWEWGGSNESIRRFINAGTYYVQVLNYNPETTDYTVSTNFSPGSSDDRKFSIQLNYGSGFNDISSTVRSALDTAAKFWENVIPSSTFNGAHNLQVNVIGQYSADDWLAAAKYDTVASDATGKAMPVTGTVKVNTQYNNTYSSNPQYLQEILIHEFAHILGIGTLWQKSGRSFIDTSSNTYKADSYAGRAYGELKGTYAPTAIPVEAYSYGHWDETKFDNELMTPRAETLSSKLPLSQMTIGALRDLGWNVNYGAADLSYILPVAITPDKPTTPSSSLSGGYQPICPCSLCKGASVWNTIGSTSLSEAIGVV